MEVATSTIISSVVDALERLIAPLTAPEGAVTVDLCIRLLRLTVSRESNMPALTLEHNEQIQRADDLAKALLVEAIGSTAVRSNRSFVGGPIGQLMGMNDREIEPALAARRALCFAGLVAAEKALIEGLDTEAAQGVSSVFDRGRLARNEDTPLKGSSILDPAIFEAYLQSRGGPWQGVHVLLVRTLEGGFGKETSLVDFVTTSGENQSIVLRRDPSVSATGLTVIDEFPIVQAAFQQGIRVAEPLWLDSGFSSAGQPFMVSRRANGSAGRGGWTSEAVHLETFIDCLALQLSRLRAMDPSVIQSFASAVNVPLRTAVAMEINRWWAMAAASGLKLNRLLAAEYEWLLGNIPQNSTNATVVHGDLGFHNIMTVNGEITAILDWEFAHVGDPQEDLNYLRPFLVSVGGWEHFLKRYEKGGVSFDPQSSRFWSVWAHFRNAAGCAGALGKFSTGIHADPQTALRMGVAGLNFGPRLTLEAGSELLAGLC